MQIAQQRQAQVCGVAGQERIAECERAKACDCADEQAEGDPARRSNIRVGFDPARTGCQVLHEQGDGHDQAGGEPSAGFIVSAQEQMRGHDKCHGHQQARDHGWHQHVSRCNRPGAFRLHEIGGLPVRQRLLLARLGDAFGWRPEASQQGVDAQCDGAEHGDLAQCVERTEVDQHDVDDIGATATGKGVAQEERRDAVRSRARQERERQDRQSAAGRDRKHEVAGPARPVTPGQVQGQVMLAHRQPAQAEQEKGRGHHLHDHLGQGQIRCREPRECQASDEASASHQADRNESMVFRENGGADRADDPDCPQQHEGLCGRQSRPITPCEGKAACSDPGQCNRGGDHDEQLRLQPSRAKHFDCAACGAGRCEQHRFERMPTVPARQQWRGLIAPPALANAQPTVSEDATDQGRHTHQQRPGDAVPDRKAVHRQHATDHGLRSGREHRTDRQGWCDADCEADQHEELDRCAHPARRFLRRARQVGRWHAEKDAVTKAQRIDHGEC